MSVTLFRVVSRVGLVAALFLAAGVLTAACGGSSHPPSASPSPASSASLITSATPTPTSSPAFRYSDAPGIRYKIANWLQMSTSAPFGTGDSAGNSYEGFMPDGDGAAFVTVSLLKMKTRPSVDDMIRVLDTDQIVKATLGKPEAKRAKVTPTRAAHQTTVGPGWPAAAAEYRVKTKTTIGGTLTRVSAASECVVFLRGGRLYLVVLAVSPPKAFKAHRHELETTLRTMHQLQ